MMRRKWDTHSPVTTLSCLMLNRWKSSIYFPIKLLASPSMSLDFSVWLSDACLLFLFPPFHLIFYSRFFSVFWAANTGRGRCHVEHRGEIPPTLMSIHFNPDITDIKGPTTSIHYRQISAIAILRFLSRDWKTASVMGGFPLFLDPS